jgi:hypothetical protein
MLVERMMITPEVAESMLRRNTKNRKISPTNLAIIMGQLRNGDWQENGESIKLDDLGNLLDGQHRLTAILKTGIPAQMLVVKGLPPEVFHTIDTGRPRRASDIFSMEGLKNATTVAASLRIINSYYQGWSATRLDGGTKKDYTNKQMLDLFQKHPKSVESAAFANNYKHKFGKFGTSLLAAWHYIFYACSEPAAKEFFDKLINGDNLQKGDPILWFREQLLTYDSKSNKLSRSYLFMMGINVWNKYRMGKKINKRFDVNLEEKAI